MSRENAVSFEGVKVAMRQTKDGYALTLVIHPDDVPPGLFATPVGQRYVVALVAVDDQEQPIPPKLPEVKESIDSRGSEAVKYAALLCKEPLFWRYLNDFIDFGVDKVYNEASAADALRRYVGVSSRSELAHDDRRRGRFEHLATEYRRWAGIDKEG